VLSLRCKCGFREKFASVWRTRIIARGENRWEEYGFERKKWGSGGDRQIGQKSLAISLSGTLRIPR